MVEHIRAFAFVPALIALQGTAFGWRINREITVGDSGRRTWLPISDLLNIASLLAVALFCVIVPILTDTFGRVSSTVVATGYALLAMHPVNTAAHYRLFSSSGRQLYADKGKDYPRITDQEWATLGVSVAAVVAVISIACR